MHPPDVSHWSEHGMHETGVSVETKWNAGQDPTHCVPLSCANAHAEQPPMSRFVAEPVQPEHKGLQTLQLAELAELVVKPHSA